MLLLFSFSLSWHLGLDAWDQFLFTNGVALVGLFPVSSHKLRDVSGLHCYHLGLLPCVSIRSVAPPLCSPVTKEGQQVVSPDVQMLTSVSCE